MTEEGPLDRAAAERIHYTDPRVRQLAAARWQLATGGTYTEWLILGKNNPEALISEGKDWMRAAVATGLLRPLQDPEKPICSWCGRGPDSRVPVVLGPGVNICGDCIELVRIASDESRANPEPDAEADETPIYCNGCRRCHGRPRSYSCSGMDCHCSAH